MCKEALREHSAMAVVMCRGRLLATVEDIYGTQRLSLPKGHLEAGETALETAIRECLEETNVTLTANDKVAELTPFTYGFTRPDGQEVIKTLTPILFVTSNMGEPKPLEERITSVRYMDVEEFLQKCSYDNVREVVRDALKALEHIK